MSNDLIIITEYCEKSHTDPSFLLLLEENGLLEMQIIDGEHYLLSSQLRDLEKYSHLHYDLSINIEGIDAIRHLLGRMDILQREVRQLRQQLHYSRSQEHLFPGE